MFNVCDFGAVGDKTTDDYPPIQAAITAAGKAKYKETVVFPAGAYGLSQGLLLESGNYPNLLGEGPFGSVLSWNLDGGSCITGAPGASYIRGFRFEGDTGKPDVWVDYDTDRDTDWGENIEDCFFHDWNPETGIAAVRFGRVLNGHYRNIRFGAGRGFAIRLKTSAAGGNFVLENFTMDSQWMPPDIVNGFINVTKGSGNQFEMRLANGRIENSSVAWTNPSGVIWVDSDPPNKLGVVPIAVHFDNVDLSADGPGLALVHQDTTQAGVGSSILLTESGFGGEICGGTWSDEVTKPTNPSGVKAMTGIGRFNSGAPETQRTNWWTQALGVGSYLELKQGAAPKPHGDGYARLYATDTDLAVRFADGTVKVLT